MLISSWLVVIGDRLSAMVFAVAFLSGVVLASLFSLRAVVAYLRCCCHYCYCFPLNFAIWIADVVAGEVFVVAIVVCCFILLLFCFCLSFLTAIVFFACWYSWYGDGCGPGCYGCYCCIPSVANCFKRHRISAAGGVWWSPLESIVAFEHETLTAMSCKGVAHEHWSAQGWQRRWCLRMMIHHSHSCIWWRYMANSDDCGK